MENTENVEHTEVIQERITNIPSNRPAAFGFNDFFNKNRKWVTYGGIALAVLILGVGYYFYTNSGKEEEAEAAFTRAERYYEQDSIKMALKGDGYATGMNDVADEYGGTKAGQDAHYFIGMAKLREGKYQEAIDNLQDFNLKSPIIYPLALGGIGDAYSDMKQYDDAVKYYLKAANFSTNDYTTPKFLKKAGIVYEKLGQYDKALEVYQKIKDNYKRQSQDGEVDKYIARAKAENGFKD